MRDFEVKDVKRSPYEQLLLKILLEGHDHVDRTGVGRRTIVAPQLRYDLSDGTVPVPTTRQVPYKASIKELVWFINGSNSNDDLRDLGTTFWDRWAVEEKHVDKFIEKFLNNQEFLTAVGETFDTVKARLTPTLIEKFKGLVGPMYGAMWRNAPRKENYNVLWPSIPREEIPSDKLPQWEAMYDQNKELYEKQGHTMQNHLDRCYYMHCDQLNELRRNLKKRPFSSRLVVTAWIPEFVPFEEFSPQDNVILGRGALAACHCKFQIVVTPGKDDEPNILNMIVDIRSSDGPVGLPHNETQYAVLAHVLAKDAGMVPGELVINLGDSHIYLNQIEKAQEQVNREAYDFPKIKISDDFTDLFQLKPEHITIEGYESHEPIVYEVAV